jgi:hypothetical protein
VGLAFGPDGTGSLLLGGAGYPRQPQLDPRAPAPWSRLIEVLVDHVSGHKAGVAGIYNRAAYANEKQDALRRWHERLERIIA